MELQRRDLVILDIMLPDGNNFVDDYVIMPFSPQELVLRVEAIYRGASRPEPLQTVRYRLDRISIKMAIHRVFQPDCRSGDRSDIAATGQK